MGAEYPLSVFSGVGLVRGVVRIIDPPRNAPQSNPGAFLVWSREQDRWMRIRGAVCSVTTSATAKTRSPQVEFTNNYENAILYGTTTDIPASTTVTLSYVVGNYPLMAVGGGACIAVPMPEIWLPPGWAFQGGLLNFDNGDVCSSASVMVEEIYTDEIERMARYNRALHEALERFG